MPQIYRLISLLPILSKVVEKVVHEQTTKFLNDNKFSININLASEITIQQACLFVCLLVSVLSQRQNFEWF